MGFFSKFRESLGKSEAVKQEITRWFNRGIEQGYAHTFIVKGADVLDDQPIYTKKGEHLDAKQIRRRRLEVVDFYDLSKPIEPQLNRSVLQVSKILTDIEFNDYKIES